MLPRSEAVRGTAGIPGDCINSYCVRKTRLLKSTTSWAGAETRMGRTHIATPGLSRAPECARDHVVYCQDEEGAWKTLVEVHGNCQWQRIHQFTPVTSTRLRLEIRTTKGDRSARVYEIRVHKTDSP